MTPFVRSAITDDHGEIDVGNLGLFVLIGLVLGVIPFVCAMVLARAIASYYHVDLAFDAQSLGLAVGSICGGYAGAVGAWGAARRLADNKGAFRDATSTTIQTPDGATQQTIVKTDAQ